MHVLVLSADPSLISTLSDVSREFAIETQHTDNHQHASNQLSRAKYAGLVLDLDTVPDARPFISSVFESPSNKTAVVFAVASKIDHIDKALEGRAHFVLRRPVKAHAVRKTIRSAYDLLSGKQRRDFRHSVNLSVRLTTVKSDESTDCTTINVSSNGIAVITPVPLNVAEAMHIELTLPDGFTVRATGVVIWSDQHEKGGLHFQCTSPEMREKLDGWLDAQFELVHSPVGIS